MIATEAANPNCMYMWMDHMMSPEANGQATVYFGEAPTSQEACDYAETIAPGHCEQTHATGRGVLGGHLVLEHAREDCADDDDRHDVRRLRRLGRGVDHAARRLTQASNPLGLRSALPGEPAPRGASFRDAMTARAPLPKSAAARPRAPGGWRPGSTLGRAPAAGCCSRATRLAGGSSTWDRWPSCCSTRSGRATRSPAGSTRSIGRSMHSSRSSATTSTGPSRFGRSVWRSLVTVTDALLAFPIAYYMARIASPRTRRPARRRDPHAALGLVPREDLRVAHDLPGKRVPVVAARRRSGSQGPGRTRSRTPGSCSATSGCRT